MTATDRRALERWTFDRWSPACLALFDATALDVKTSFTASLVIVDRGPVPAEAAELIQPAEARTTLLSAGELYAPDALSLWIALWPQARGTRALVRERAAVLTFVADGAFHQARLRAEPAGSTADGLACFRMALVGGEAQRVGYAQLTSDVTFELGEGREAVVSRWARQLEQLRALADAGRPEVD